MPRLIWVFAGRTVILLLLSWGGSNVWNDRLVFEVFRLVEILIVWNYYKANFWIFLVLLHTSFEQLGWYFSAQLTVSQVQLTAGWLGAGPVSWSDWSHSLLVYLTLQISYLFCTIRLIFLSATYCISGSADRRVTRGGASFLIRLVT